MLRNDQVAFTVATLVWIVVATSAQEEGCEPLRSPNYTLFGHQTAYESARAYLNSSDTYLAASFGDHSLDEEHRKLVMEGCQPVGLFFVGRHAASYPAHQVELEDALLSLQHRLASKRRHRCPQRVAPYLSWRPQTGARGLAGQASARGLEEERSLARRLKRLYASLFDARQAEIRLGVTERLATAQSASEFLAEVDGWRYAGCGSTSTHSSGGNSSACLERLLQQNRLPYQLEFRRKCREQLGESNAATTDPLLERLEGPTVGRRMAKRLSDRLRLRLSEEELADVYEMCAEESAMLKIDSIWCHLFTRRELGQLEFVRDVASHQVGAAHGDSNQKKGLSCPLISDMLNSVSALNMRSYSAQTNKTKPQTYFYFTDGEHFEQLLGDLGLFEDLDSYSERRVDDFLSTRARVPGRRDWRSSVVAPEGANLALATYECRAGATKLLASVTEWPVKLAGCQRVACAASDFLAAYAPMRNCRLEELCSPSSNRLDPPKNDDNNEDYDYSQEEEEDTQEEDYEEDEEDYQEETPKKRSKVYVRRKDGTLTIVYN